MKNTSYCLTYFLVKYSNDNFIEDFCQQLNLDYENVKRFGTEETLELGRNEIYDHDINVMIRKTIKDLIGKEDTLLELKEKYNLEYYIERVPIIDGSHQILSLSDDIIEFMYKTKTKDDLDYHL